MVERARIRCPVCRTAVPLTVPWEAGDACPSCSRPLHAARRRPEPAGALGKTLLPLHAEAHANPAPPDAAS